jgi:hypothetical protein
VPSEIRAPKLSYEMIRRSADDFLLTYHPAMVLPVPIEEIIDLRLRVNIVPVPGLRQAFDIDAFTSSDCTEITVDEAIYNRQPHRYRFSLAHELGHMVLHGAIYQHATFRTVDDWIAFVRECPGDEHTWLEYQAYSFGGLILVPRQLLESETEGAVRKALESGVNVHPSDAAAWEYIAEYIASRFWVSREVVLRRLPLDKVITLRWLRSRQFL